MGALEAVTVITGSHLPHARVLADSLAEHVPEARLTVVVVDGPSPPGAFHRTLTPLELGLDERELHARAMLYDSQGLISSLRPLAISRLLDEGAESVLLLDADLLALGPLEDLWQLSAERGVLLTPHTLDPRRDPASVADHEVFLRTGTFNGGVLGVGQCARAFPDWMAARVGRDCLRDPARGLLYSQTWLNLVPGLFDHCILRDPGINVTPQRLGGRDVDAEPGPRLDGSPVRLYHFTGFDPARPERLSRFLPPSEAGLEARPNLARLYGTYHALLARQGWPAPVEYGWAQLPGGLAADEVMRSVFRGAVIAAEAGLAPAPPDPFDRRDPDAFLRWLREPVAEVSRYLLALSSERSDLRQAFAKVPGQDLPGFLQWVENQSQAGDTAAQEVPAELLPPESARRQVPGARLVRSLRRA